MNQNESVENEAPTFPQWKVHGLDLTIRSFGKVVNARIKTAPLTIFVGKNNTGKSYISTLVWSLSQPARFLRSEEEVEHRPEWFQEAFERLVAFPESEQEIVITRLRANQMINHFNDALRRNGRNIFRDIFAFDGFDTARLTINAPQFDQDFTLRFRLNPTRPGSKRSEINLSFITVNQGTVDSTIPWSNGKFDAVSYIYARLLARILYGNHSFFDSAYVPAARTGLMLSYKTIVSQLFDSVGLESKGNQRLQLPQNITEFLRDMTYDWEMESSPARIIAEWIEEKLLSGNLTLSDDQIPNVTYRPKDSEVEIPMHASSSMITELAPILIALKRSIGLDQIILEEPEAHLHLSAQRIMAQAIARLVNAGIAVVITTHSDTLIQQINNLIKLGRVRNLMTEHYSAEDRISASLVAGYEFVSTEEGTRVIKLEMLDEGLVVPSLNDTLLNMAQETIHLNSMIEDLGDV